MANGYEAKTTRKLHVNTKLAYAIAHTQPVHKLIDHKYVVKEVNGQWTLAVGESILAMAA